LPIYRDDEVVVYGSCGCIVWIELDVSGIQEEGSEELRNVRTAGDETERR
jgi:hypothetical protein